MCHNRCSQPCASCIEGCGWECSHQGRCPVVCGAPCSRLPCNEVRILTIKLYKEFVSRHSLISSFYSLIHIQRCRKRLSCGHQCPSVCGEKCPPAAMCHNCGHSKYKTQVVDMFNMSTYQDHHVNSDPVLFLSW